MTHYRAMWRQAVLDAILAHPDYRDTIAVQPWNQNLSADELPCLTVQTDREEITRLTKVTSRRSCTVRVLLWRRDNDRLDETLDNDSAVIEPLVLEALRPLVWDLEATETQVQFDGQTRVGMLAMTVTVMRDTPIGDPLTED